jgi:hypothetical protein
MKEFDKLLAQENKLRQKMATTPHKKARKKL